MIRARLFFASIFAMVLAFGIAGCDTFGLQKPQSAQDTVQYGKSIATGAYLTIEQNVGTSIPAAEARSYFDTVKAQRANLDAAQKLADALPANASSLDVTAKVNLAVGALQALLVELKKRYPTVKEVPPKLAR
jgi:hypothetical protein